MSPARDETRRRALDGLLANSARVAIVGGPRTGKTRLSVDVYDGRPVIHTDEFSDRAWADVPAALFGRCAPLPRFLIEGVQVARALRAGLAVDAVLYLDDHVVEQTPRKAAMGKAVATVFAEWRARNRTVHVVSPDLGVSS